jgi:hypothetical protein
LRARQLPAAQALLAKAAQNGAVDRQRVDSLRHWVGTTWPQRLDELRAQVAQQVEGAVTTALQHAEFVLATDAKDRDQVTNRVLGRGAFDGHVTRLLAGIDAIATAAVHDEFQEAAPGVARGEQKAQVERALAHLRQLAVTTLDAVRMPPAASTDAELLAIAEQTLKQPAYGVGPWRRLVINSALQHRERREGTLTPDTNVVRMVMHHYVWDEFQVVTAEPVGDDVWLWFQTLKRFESGDATTPIGRWIVSNRFESTRILPANVDR